MKPLFAVKPLSLHACSGNSIDHVMINVRRASANPCCVSDPWTNHVGMGALITTHQGAHRVGLRRAGTITSRSDRRIYLNHSFHCASKRSLRLSSGRPLLYVYCFYGEPPTWFPGLPWLLLFGTAMSMLYCEVDIRSIIVKKTAVNRFDQDFTACTASGGGRVGDSALINATRKEKCRLLMHSCFSRLNIGLHHDNFTFFNSSQCSAYRPGQTTRSCT